MYLTDFYPRPPRGGRLIVLTDGKIEGRISTHALREEGDMHLSKRANGKKISTHALREEGDWKPIPEYEGLYISTHALREEGDGIVQTIVCDGVQFLPTPSARRATKIPGW